MSVKVKELDSIPVLHVKGKLLGGGETAEVHEKVKEAIEQGSKKLVIDLSKVKWLNSQGMGMLMACLTSVRNADGRLAVAGSQEKVKSALMITKLATIFETYDTPEEAVGNLK